VSGRADYRQGMGPLVRTFTRYALGGMLLFSGKAGLTYLLTDVMGMYYLWAYGIALGLVVLGGFLYSAYVTFRRTRHKLRNFLKYCCVLGGFSLVDGFLVRCAVEYAGMHYLAAIVLSTGLIFIIKFFIYHRLVFT